MVDELCGSPDFDTLHSIHYTRIVVDHFEKQIWTMEHLLIHTVRGQCQYLI